MSKGYPWRTGKDGGLVVGHSICIAPTRAGKTFFKNDFVGWPAVDADAAPEGVATAADEGHAERKER